MIQEITVKALKCWCQVCHFAWVTLEPNPPKFCRNQECKSREWNGKKERVRKQKSVIVLPRPKKVRSYESDPDNQEP